MSSSQKLAQIEWCYPFAFTDEESSGEAFDRRLCESKSSEHYGFFLGLNFTGKETDCETGYFYFGARYYDATLLTSFLSIDRYADKYPSLSPYHYCAWNPIKLTDPNGDSLRIMGTQEQREAVIGALNQRYENLSFDCDNNGYITLNDNFSTIESRNDEYIQTMINDKNNISTLYVSNGLEIEHNGTRMIMNADSHSMFGGNEFVEDKVVGKQYIDFQYFQKVSSATADYRKFTGDEKYEQHLLGAIIMHEFSEGYEGCLIAAQTGEALKINTSDYLTAHTIANAHFKGDMSPVYTNAGDKVLNVMTLSGSRL